MKLARVLPVLVLLAGCAAPYRLLDPWSGEDVSLSAMADRLEDADVVILGENHRSDEGHVAQLDLVKALHRRRPDLVISMEMFERDVQVVLWEYLRGSLDEDEFLADSRPWSNYRRHYRPIVEYARQNRLPVLAADVPRPLVARVARQGLAARQVSTPRDRYWRRFRAAMTSHPHGFDGEDALYRAYQAQCLRDEAMAECIAEQLEAARSQMRSPLVVHINGRFHSDHGLGVAARLRERAPDKVVAVVSMVQRSRREEAFLTGSGPPGDFVILVPDVLPPEPSATPGEEAAKTN